MENHYKLRLSYGESGSRERYALRDVRADDIGLLYPGRTNTDAAYDEVRAKARERFSYKM